MALVFRPLPSPTPSSAASCQSSFLYPSDDAFAPLKAIYVVSPCWASGADSSFLPPELRCGFCAGSVRRSGGGAENGMTYDQRKGHTMVRSSAV